MIQVNAATELKLLQIFFILDSVTKNNHLVGGCVRDMLLSRTVKDFDVVTDAPIATLAPMFAHNGWDVDLVGEAFLVLAISKDGEQYEIANFRKDSIISDGRRPEQVTIGTIEEDAARRDFTVNALYLHPWTMDVQDPTGRGLKDIQSKTLRFIGKPEDRIKEDYLRVFRFYRFMAKGFAPHPRSLRAVRSMFNEACEKTNPERIRAEIEKTVGL